MDATDSTVAGPAFCFRRGLSFGGGTTAGALRLSHEGGGFRRSAAAQSEREGGLSSLAFATAPEERAAVLLGPRLFTSKRAGLFFSLARGHGSKMSVNTYWSFKSTRGLFYVRPRDDGRFQYFFEEEALESQSSPEDCAFALASGTGTWPSCGDPSALGIPSDLRKWTKIRT